jgi:hypothetical protein
MTGARHDCSRTRGMIERLVAGSVRDDDRRHAAACPSCGPVFTRAARFEDELERSARQLIAEDLPRGILDPGIARQAGGVAGMRSLAPGATAGVAALAVVIFATVVGIRPVLQPGPSPTAPPLAIEMPGGSALPYAPLWTLNELTLALARNLEYQCAAGDAPPSEDAVAAAVCTAPPGAGPFEAEITLEAADSGMVVRVTMTAQIVGTLSPDQSEAARRAVAGALAKVTAEAFTGQGAGIRAANFVFVKASQLSGPAWAMGIEEGGVRVDLQRLGNGGYIVHLAVAACGPGARASGGAVAAATVDGDGWYRRNRRTGALGQARPRRRLELRAPAPLRGR